MDVTSDVTNNALPVAEPGYSNMGGKKILSFFFNEETIVNLTDLILHKRNYSAKITTKHTLCCVKTVAKEEPHKSQQPKIQHPNTLNATAKQPNSSNKTAQKKQQKQHQISAQKPAFSTKKQVSAAIQHPI